MKSLEQALEAAGKIPGEKVNVSRHAKFTKSEHNVLEALAALEGVPLNVMIRRAVMQAAESKSNTESD